MIFGRRTALLKYCMRVSNRNLKYQMAHWWKYGWLHRTEYYRMFEKCNTAITFSYSMDTLKNPFLMQHYSQLLKSIYLLSTQLGQHISNYISPMISIESWSFEKLHGTLPVDIFYTLPNMLHLLCEITRMFLLYLVIYVFIFLGWVDNKTWEYSNGFYLITERCQKNAMASQNNGNGLFVQHRVWAYIKEIIKGPY